MAGQQTCLLWDTPELQLSLGEGPLARLLPQIWVPVGATSGVLLPRNVRLSKALVSEAGDAVSAAGELELRWREEEPGAALALR